MAIKSGGNVHYASELKEFGSSANVDDSAGRTIPSGVYVYEIIAGGRRTTGKLTRLK